MVKVRRKYNLGRLDIKYETIEIELEGDDIDQLIQQIDRYWQRYAKRIREGAVE